ncbi:MAG TPA: AsmA family protein [Beijerinckiaceae bacterium]
MRDILTVIAGILILVLAAALVVPPLIAWEAHRDALDRALSEAAGTEARTEGRIEVRLLPSPRVRVDRLRLGSGRPDAPSLFATFVKAEVALTPLLRGEVRFTDTRLGRAEIRVPTAPDGAWRLPPDLAADALRRDWAFEDLRIGQLLVTTVAPATGRTDQVFAEEVRVAGQTLAGPWRVEGLTAGVPFRLATGELAPDNTVPVKLSGGGDVHPRFEIDARVALGGDGATPGVSGTARLLFGPPGQVAAAGLPIPVVIQTGFKTAAGTLELDNVSLEAGEGGSTLRLAGGGTMRLAEPALSLKLEGRRLDVDAFLLSPAGQEFKARMARWGPPPVDLPIDLDLTLSSIGLAQEELSGLVLQAGLRKGKAEIRRLAFTAPGQTKISAEGEIGLTIEGGGSGRIALASDGTDRLLRYLGRLDIALPFANAIEGQPLEASADVSFAPPVAAFRNLRLKVGDATLTGSARYSAPEGNARGKLDAQVAVQGLDLDRFPELGSVLAGIRALDLGLIVDARGVRHGGREGIGRISARIRSDGPALEVEALDVVDLAGANARLAGRIEPDGAGSIAGKVTAKRAAPLVDLLGRVWVGGVSRLIPYFLREGDLDLDVTAARAGPDPRAAPRLRTTAKGRAAGGLFEADAVTAEGVTENLRVRLATENTGVWVDKPAVAALRRRSDVELKGVRVPSGLFAVTVEGEVGGVKVHTTRPFALGSGDDVVDSGEATLATPDVTPFLVLLGDGAGVDPPVPVQIKVGLGRERDASQLDVTGRIADGAVQARLAVRSRADVTGTIAVDRLSLPWLAASFALNPAHETRAVSLWSPARFGESARLIQGGQVSLQAKRVELGRGHRAENAAFAFAITPDGAAVRDFAADYALGRLTGALTITRQGSLAAFVGEGAVENSSLEGVLGPSPFAGRLSGRLSFGASGESIAGIVANLAGSGDVRISDLKVPNADPGALDRALPRALAESDPLGTRRLEGIMTSEFAKGPLQAAVVAAPATMVGGVLRLSPVTADAGAATWQGTVAVDVKTLGLDARGTLTTRAVPKGWTGGAPYVGLAWRGPMVAPLREVDVGPLTNGLAAIVLQRELERIEAFEMEANERARLNGRRSLDQARERDRLAAEEAAREAARQAELQERAARQREEAERQARLRAEEAERQARLRAQQEAERLARQRAEREEAERQIRLRREQQQQQAEEPGTETPVRSPPMRPPLFAPPASGPLQILPPGARPPG